MPGATRSLTRAIPTLAAMSFVYTRTIAPVVRTELVRWAERARAIEDPELRALALSKLQEEGSHAQAAAMLATLAAHERREEVTRAIVALELLFDYLDGVTERPSGDPLADSRRWFGALTGAFEPAPRAQTGVNRCEARSPAGPLDGSGLEPKIEAEPEPKPDLGDYLEGLSREVASTLASLPAAPAIAEVAQRTAARAAEAQTRMHAAGRLGAEQVERWARDQTAGGGLQWRELLAGAASSVLVLHALIVAAADPRTTREDALALEHAYLATCAVLTLLDGVADHDRDAMTPAGEASGYLDLYRDRDDLSRAAVASLREAVRRTMGMREGAHHLALLVGVVAYCTSDPGARGEYARPIVRAARRELRPAIRPALALMHAWRASQRRPQQRRQLPLPRRRRRRWAHRSGRHRVSTSVHLRWED